MASQAAHLLERDAEALFRQVHEDFVPDLPRTGVVLSDVEIDVTVEGDLYLSTLLVAFSVDGRPWDEVLMYGLVDAGDPSTSVEALRPHFVRDLESLQRGERSIQGDGTLIESREC